MTNTKDVLEKFNEAVDINKEYTKNELCLILNTVYKEVYSKKNVKKEKRPPTKYNNFVSENMKKMKEEFPELTRQNLMKKIGELWRKQKEDNESKEEESKEETKKEETKEESKEENIQEEESKEDIQEEKKPKKKVTKKNK
ncbi:HMG-box domain-containing protein [bacterium]|nr:HMG-box domain-containing protein [bacterium]